MCGRAACRALSLGATTFRRTDGDLLAANKNLWEATTMFVDQARSPELRKARSRPTRKLADRLEKRLVAYSLAAGATAVGLLSGAAAKADTVEYPINLRFSPGPCTFGDHFCNESSMFYINFPHARFTFTDMFTLHSG